MTPTSGTPTPGTPTPGTPAPGQPVSDVPSPTAGDHDLPPDRFGPGMPVRVRNDWPELRGPAHIRTPHYLRGREGRVVRLLGHFPNPEDLAFARPAPRLPLYHVAFAPQAIWPDAGSDELVVEIFGPWLEASP